MDTILYIQPPSQPYVPEKLSGVRAIAARRGAHVQLVNQEPTISLIAELVSFWSAIGAIVECSTRRTPLDTAAFGKLPVVLLSPPPGQRGARSLSVSHDSVLTAQTAARELLSTGFSHFAFVPYPEPRFWSRTRERTFIDAIRRHGHDCKAFHPKSSPEMQDAEPTSTAWLMELREFLSSLPKPCGVFAANDGVAEKVLTVARLEGIAVPDNLAVLGVDNDVRVCQRCTPSLSSIDLNFRSAGMLAAELVFEAAAKGSPMLLAKERKLDFGPLRVVLRESLRENSIADKHVSDALALIRHQACDGLRATDVADRFPCSRRLAYVHFREATGHSILEEIHAVKLATVKRLLETSDIPLKALSDFCGFENPNSLRKFFLRETGMTLRAWRAEKRNGKI